MGSSGADCYRRRLCTSPNAPRHSPHSALSTRRAAKPASSAATSPTTPLHVLSLLNDIVFVETSQALGKLLGVIKSESSIARRKAALCKVVGTECPGGR
jgi:hypothetical protein